jgi:hypothetical protein
MTDDELVRSLTRERFTRHQRVTEPDAPIPDVEGWLRLKELREALQGQPDEIEDTA